MNDIDTMLAKQFLLRVRQEGYSLVEKPPQSLDGINIDIYRGETKICTFDNRQLGEAMMIFKSALICEKVLGAFAVQNMKAYRHLQDY